MSAYFKTYTDTKRAHQKGPPIVLHCRAVRLRRVDNTSQTPASSVLRMAVHTYCNMHVIIYSHFSRFPFCRCVQNLRFFNIIFIIIPSTPPPPPPYVMPNTNIQYVLILSTFKRRVCFKTHSTGKNNHEHLTKLSINVRFYISLQPNSTRYRD